MYPHCSVLTLITDLSEKNLLKKCNGKLACINQIKLDMNGGLVIVSGQLREDIISSA